MNGYLLFVGSEYEKIGGWINFEGCFPTQKDAEDAGLIGLDTPGNDWYHIVDTSTEIIVSSKEKK